MMSRLQDISLALTGSRRNDIAQSVLRPGHQLPTMTLAELGEREYQEAAERDERQKRAEEERARRKEAAREGSDDEDELRRQRAFDDFKVCAAS